MSFASGELTKTPKHCKGCIYREALGVSICNYCLRTGKPRGCPPEECTHYEKRKKEKKCFPD